MYTTNKIESLLREDEVGLALLIVSVRVENELYTRVRNHFGLSKEDYEDLKLGSKGLGWHVAKACENDLVKSEYRNSLDNLAKKRSSLVHDDGYLETMEGVHSSRKEIKQLVFEVIEFLEESE